MVLQYGKHPVVRQPILIREGSERAPIITGHARPPGAEPDMPMLILEHRSQQFVRETVLLREDRQVRSRIPAHPLERSEPQISFPVHQGGEHLVVCQAILRGEGGKTGPVISAHPSAEGPEPQMAVVVLQAGHHPIVRKAVPGREGPERPPIVARHAAPAAISKPETPLLVLRHTHRDTPRHLISAIESELLAIVASQPAEGTEPQVPLSILQDSPSDKAELRYDPGELLAIVPTDSGDRAEPETPAPILHDRAHLVVRQTVFSGERRERLPIIAADPPVRPEPQVPTPVLTDGAYDVMRQAIFGGERHKLCTVVANHTAALRAKPQIALPVLADGMDDRDWEAIRHIECLP